MVPSAQVPAASKRNFDSCEALALMLPVRVTTTVEPPYVVELPQSPKFANAAVYPPICKLDCPPLFVPLWVPVSHSEFKSYFAKISEPEFELAGAEKKRLGISG